MRDDDSGKKVSKNSPKKAKMRGGGTSRGRGIELDGLGSGSC